MTAPRYRVLRPGDDVAVALDALPAGEAPRESAAATAASGRGTASAPSRPSTVRQRWFKLATNSEMAKHMAADMDFDCGRILTGDLSLAAAGEAIYGLLLDAAGGTRSASERNGLGDFEFVPWQLGAVL
jgi:altronate hydrolase